MLRVRAIQPQRDYNRRSDHCQLRAQQRCGQQLVRSNHELFDVAGAAMARLGKTADVRAVGADDGNLGAGEEGLQD